MFRMLTIDGKISNKMANMSVVCAFMVIALHMGNPRTVGSDGWWFYVIMSQMCKVAVPWFFLAAGFFLGADEGNRNWYRHAVIKRLKSIGIPFFAWSLLWAMFFIPVCCRQQQDITSSVSFILEHWKRIIGLDLFVAPFYSVLWFLRSLFLFVLLSPGLLWLTKRFSWAFVILLFSGDVLFRIFAPNLPDWFQGVFSFVFSLEGAAYFVLGLGVRSRYIRGFDLDRVCNLAFFVVISIICGTSFLYRSNTFHIFSFEGVVIPLVMVVMWYKIPAKAFPRWLITSTFPVYLIHPFLLAVLTGTVFKNSESAVLLGSKMAIAWLGSVCLSIVLHMWLPRASRVLFGGR